MIELSLTDYIKNRLKLIYNHYKRQTISIILEIDNINLIMSYIAFYLFKLYLNEFSFFVVA